MSGATPWRSPGDPHISMLELTQGNIVIIPVMIEYLFAGSLKRVLHVVYRAVDKCQFSSQD
jgi:hypothetical protein